MFLRSVEFDAGFLAYFAFAFCGSTADSVVNYSQK
jgi:hypothetical protein